MGALATDPEGSGNRAPRHFSSPGVMDGQVNQAEYGFPESAQGREFRNRTPGMLVLEDELFELTF